MPADRNGQRWTQEETLTAFVLYMHLPRELFYKRNADIIALSKALGRVPGSVARKLSNTLFDVREEVMIEVRFPDLGYEVGDWAFSYPEESDGPTLVTTAHGSSFDFPDVVARLRALVDRAAYYSFVD